MAQLYQYRQFSLTWNLTPYYPACLISLQMRKFQFQNKLPEKFTYDSVDDGSLSYAVSQKSTESKIWAVKGQNKKGSSENFVSVPCL